MGCWKEIFAYGNRLHSAHCREFPYLKLCRFTYCVRTTQLLPHPGHGSGKFSILYYSPPPRTVLSNIGWHAGRLYNYVFLCHLHSINLSRGQHNFNLNVGIKGHLWISCLRGASFSPYHKITNVQNMG